MAAGVQAEFDERGILRLSGVLKQLQEDSSDLEQSGAWQAVSMVMSEEFESLFDAEGAHRGPRWSRLSPVTVELRQKRNHVPIKIGWATGRMATSLIEPTHPESIEVTTPVDFIRGTSVHNEGVSYPTIFERGRRNRGRQPPRPIIGRLFRRGNTRTVSRLVEAIEKRVFRSVKTDRGEP